MKGHSKKVWKLHFSEGEGERKKGNFLGKESGSRNIHVHFFFLQCQLRCEAADENGMVSWNHVRTRDEKRWWYFQPPPSFRGDPKKKSLYVHIREGQ